MKKIILVLAVMALAVPAMAGITVQATDLGSGVCQVRYTMDGGDVNIPRAFALDVTMSPANGTTLAPYAFDPNFYVAPGTFTYDPCTGATNWGNPIVGPNTVKFTTEMGSLWDACDVNHPTQPPSSGTLLSFTVDKTCVITLAQNAQRGGVVMENTAVTFPAGYVTLNGCTMAGAGCTVPNIVGMDRVSAIAAIIAAGFTVGTESNVPPTVTYTTLRTVTVQSPAPGSQPCGTPVNFSAVSYPVKVTAAIYANWINRSRPACWAYPRQCRGDSDGLKAGLYWVGQNDLTNIRAAISKAESALPPGGICSDNDHLKAGLYWVGQNDLNTFRLYISKAESLVPMCGNTAGTDPNYLYWCVPTGATCPAGQTCAPVGVCPNSL